MQKWVKIIFSYKKGLFLIRIHIFFMFFFEKNSDFGKILLSYLHLIDISPKQGLQQIFLRNTSTYDIIRGLIIIINYPKWSWDDNDSPKTNDPFIKTQHTIWLFIHPRLKRLVGTSYDATTLQLRFYYNFFSTGRDKTFIDISHSCANLEIL